MNLLRNVIAVVALIAILFWLFGSDNDSSDQLESTIEQPAQGRPSDKLPSNARAIALVKALPCGNKQIGKETIEECLQAGVSAGHFEDLGWTVERRYRDLRVINKRKVINTINDRGEPLISDYSWLIDSERIRAESVGASAITQKPFGYPYD